MTIIHVNTAYRISENAINLVENALDNPNLVQVSVASDCVIVVRPKTEGYDAGGIERLPNGESPRWKVSGVNTRLNNADANFIYIRLERETNDALLVFDTKNRNIDGSIIVEGEITGDNSAPDPTYYYMKVGQITATDSVSSPTVKRNITFDFGYYQTDGFTDDTISDLLDRLKDKLDQVVWDRNWVEKKDPNGLDYLFTTKPIVTAAGVTMYSGDTPHLPSMFEGIPLDGETLAWVDGKITVIGGTGQGGITGINVTGAGNAVTGASLSADGLTITLTKGSEFALKSDIPSLSGYATENWVSTQLGNYATSSSLKTVSDKLNNFLEGTDADGIINKWKELENFLAGQTQTSTLAQLLSGKADKATTLAGYGITDAYTKTEINTVLGDYVTKAGAQDITGIKSFVNGLKVGGILVKKHADGVVEIDGDLVVTGGVTMYGIGKHTASTILDALPIDSATLSKEGGKLSVIGGTGASTGSITLNGHIYEPDSEGNITLPSYPTTLPASDVYAWAKASTKPTYTFTELTSHPTTISGYGITDAYTRTEINSTLANYATNASLSAVSNKLNTFLEGTDTDNIINKWKELEAFLSGFTETDTLASALSVKADKAVSISAGAGLTGGGTLAANRTLSLSASGVTAGTYTKTTVDVYGRVTAGSNLSDADIPSLDWSKIATGKPTTIAGYGITDAYTKNEVNTTLGDYVTLAGAQNITGVKSFINGLKIGDITVKKHATGVIEIDGDLIVTGGVTMYAQGNHSASTILDALPIDADTLSKEGGVLSVIGGVGGGSVDGIILNGTTYSPNADTKLITLPNYPTTLPASDVYAWAKASSKPSYSWPEITSKPSWIGSSKPSYAFSEITGKPTTLAGYGITDAPTKTGGGASGTWGINITGQATSATKWTTARNFYIADKSSYYTGAATAVNGTANVTLHLPETIHATSFTAGDKRFNECLASYNSGTASVTGTICITLPNGFINSMNIYEIYIYEYNSRAASVITIGGYNYNGSNSWINTGYHIRGAFDKKVRFGYNGSKCVILLGETTNVWNYPQVYLKSVFSGHSNQDKWATGYSISIITSESGYTSITPNRATEYFGSVKADGTLTISASTDAKLLLKSTDADNYCLIKAINSNDAILSTLGYYGNGWKIDGGVILNQNNYSTYIDSRYALKSGDVISGRFDVCSVGTGAYSGGIVLRENNRGHAMTGNINESPRISFHWSGRYIRDLAMSSSGKLIWNNVFTVNISKSYVDHGTSSTKYTADEYYNNFIANTSSGYAERGSWYYAGNGAITTDFGDVHLAGVASYTWHNNVNFKTMLFITPGEYSVGTDMTYEMLFYSSNGSGYKKGWTRVVTNRNYSSILDARYYTESEADSRFVNVSGDEMTGQLSVCSVGTTAHNGGIQLRENNYGGALNGNNNEAPRLTFHWGGRYEKELLMDGSGRLVWDGNLIWHAGNTGLSSALEAGKSGKLHIWDVRATDRLPNYFDSKTLTAFFNNIGMPTANWWSGIVVSGWTNPDYVQWQLAGYSDVGQAGEHSLCYREGQGSTWQPWKALAFTTDNVASATKLQTARKINGTAFDGTVDITTVNWGTTRTLSLSGNASGSVSINGGSNVTLSVSNNYASSAGKLNTARTLWGRSFDGTGNVSGDMSSVGTILSSANNTKRIGSASNQWEGVYAGWVSGGDGRDLILAANNSNKVWILTNGNVGIGFSPSSAYKLHVNGNIRAEGYLSCGEDTDDKYGYVNVTRLKSINACCFSFIAAGTFARGIGYTTGGDIWIGTPNTSKQLSSAWLTVSSSGISSIGGVTANNGYLKSVAHDKTITIGSQNTSYCHYETDAPLHWFNTTISINGNIYSYGGARQIGESTTPFGTIYMNNWFRSIGATGWYSETYGGGIYMTDRDYVRVYNGKSFYVPGNILATGGVTMYGSDVTKKDVISRVLLPLDYIARAPLWRYRWNDRRNDRVNVGGSAQYTRMMLGELVGESDKGLVMDYATTAYAFSVCTARHFRDFLDNEFRTHETEIDKLKKENEKMKRRIVELERRVA